MKNQRLSAVILAALCCTAFSGCENQPGSMLTGKEIPITRPDAVAPVGTDTSPAASQPSSVPVREFPAQPNSTNPPGPVPLEKIGDVLRPTPSTTPATKVLPSELTDPLPATSPATHPAGSEVLAASIIQVNGQYITVDEIVRSTSRELGDIPKGLPREKFVGRCRSILSDETRKQISEALVMTEAGNRLNDDQKKKIDAEVDQVQKEMVAEEGDGSVKKLEQVLLKEGTSLQTVRDNYRRRLIVRSYMHEKLEPGVKINRPMLWEYYTKNKAQFTAPKRVQMQIISVPIADYLPADALPAEQAAAKDKARKRIEHAAEDISKGKDFGQAAKEYSRDSKAADGGLWPLMPEGSYRQVKVEQAAFALEQGKTSGVIETDSGFYLVKAAKVEPGKTTSFEDAQKEIEAKLREQQEQELAEQFFNKLLETSTIVQYNQFLDLAVEKAIEKFYKDR